MTATTRRELNREAVRLALINAGRHLLLQGRPDDFTVDRLAAEADVSRRTVFNYFESLDAVVVAVCARELGVLIDSFRRDVESLPIGDGSPDCIFTEIATVLRATDLLPVVAFMTEAYALQKRHVHASRNVEEAFVSVTDILRNQVLARYPDSDPLDVALLTHTLMQGLAVIAARWIAEGDGALDTAGRQRWSDLLNHLLALSWVGRERDGAGAEADGDSRRIR